MSRNYMTHSKMLHDKFSDAVFQPDLKMVDQLHAYLDMVAITNEQLAMAIDMVVAGLIRCDNPPITPPPEPVATPVSKKPSCTE